MPASAKTRWTSVSVMLSGCAGQPGMFTIGMPAFDFHFQPRWSVRPMAPVGLFFIAGMPPLGGARPARAAGGGLGREPVDPLGGGDRLAGVGVVAHRREV